MNNKVSFLLILFGEIILIVTLLSANFDLYYSILLGLFILIFFVFLKNIKMDTNQILIKEFKELTSLSIHKDLIFNDLYYYDSDNIKYLCVKLNIQECYNEVLCILEKYYNKFGVEYLLINNGGKYEYSKTLNICYLHEI